MIEDSLNMGKIYIFGEITNKTSLNFQYKIDYAIVNKLNKIDVFINSEGGDVESALSIVDRIAIEKEKIEINTIGIGLVASSAIFILLEGSHRYATTNTTLMMHSIKHTIEDYHIQIEKYAKFHHKFYNSLIGDLALKCGQKNKKAFDDFFKQVNDSAWLNLEEAIKLGLVEKEWKG
jgi:ATP-dependent Clp protease, protease subunit